MIMSTDLLKHVQEILHDWNNNEGIYFMINKGSNTHQSRELNYY